MFNVYFLCSRQNSFGLIVAPDQGGNATGDLFWDDGDTVGRPIKNTTSHYGYKQ